MQNQPVKKKKTIEKDKNDQNNGPYSNRNNMRIDKTEIKNAHAAGMGALERSEENKIDKINYDEVEKDDSVY